MTSPAAILAKAIAAFATGDKFKALVLRSGVRPKAIRHAINGAKGHPTDAGDYLRLCAAIGIDPMDGHRDTSHVPGELDRKLFAAGVRLTRYGRKQTMRDAAKEMGMSATTLCMIENGMVRSIDSMLAACRYVGVHPCHYVLRETEPKTKALQSAA